MSGAVRIGSVVLSTGDITVLVKPDGAVIVGLSGIKEIPPLSAHAAEKLAELIADAAKAAPRLRALHREYEAQQGKILQDLQSGIAAVVVGGES